MNRTICALLSAPCIDPQGPNCPTGSGIAGESGLCLELGNSRLTGHINLLALTHPRALRASSNSNSWSIRNTLCPDPALAAGPAVSSAEADHLLHLPRAPANLLQPPGRRLTHKWRLRRHCLHSAILPAGALTATATAPRQPDSPPRQPRLSAVDPIRGHCAAGTIVVTRHNSGQRARSNSRRGARLSPIVDDDLPSDIARPPNSPSPSPSDGHRGRQHDSRRYAASLSGLDVVVRLSRPHLSTEHRLVQ